MVVAWSWAIRTELGEKDICAMKGTVASLVTYKRTDQNKEIY